MITEIGIVAGEIWHYLDQQGDITFSQLKNGVDRPKEVLLMSLGWLAREGYVIVDKAEDDYKIALRRS